MTAVFMLIAIATVLCGIIMLVQGLRTHGRARASERWPTTPGRITHSALTTHTSRRKNTLYGVDIRYRYTADGREREGTRIKWDGDYESSVGTWQRAMVARYPEGATVSVHYDPAEPESAVIEPANRHGIWVKLGSSLAAIGVGAALAVALWKSG